MTLAPKPLSLNRRDFLAGSMALAIASSFPWRAEGVASDSPSWKASPWPEGFACERAHGGDFVLAAGKKATADVALLGDASQELVRNAAGWLNDAIGQSTAATLRIGGEELVQPAGRHIVAIIGDHPLLARLTSQHQLKFPADVGEQGYVIQRVDDAAAGELLTCWSPASIGCRYGLIELLRELDTRGGAARLRLQRVVERPRFPVRICYVNFAEHLQNAYNPNLLFDEPTNQWSNDDWDRFIDMVSAFRYNVFEFWLVPTLFSKDALQGAAIQRKFAETMNHVIAYAKRRGVTVHPIQAVNTVGSDWHFHCPHVKEEHDELVALWDHWSKALEGLESMGLFPGDPGGCTKNGCTPETYIDLCLELSKVIRKNRPQARIEVGTWGEPFAGWGSGLWTGTTQRAASSMEYLLSHLKDFPPDTFASINLGFSPDCNADSHGGDGKPYAKRAAKTNTVLTWDYSVTEGESTVSPRCRVRRTFARRREELAVGCYSGGICYTMAPRLQLVSIFACAESWWDPSREPEDALRDFGRLVFGPENADIGPLLEEFEVIPDWGHYPPFPYTPQRLKESMAKLSSRLDQVDRSRKSTLPLATTAAAYRDELAYFARLFGKLAETALLLDQLDAAAAAAGCKGESKNPLSLVEAEAILAPGTDTPAKVKLRGIADQLKALDVRSLTQEYWTRVYGIYDRIPHPVDPRAQGATSGLFNHFHCRLAMAAPATPLEPLLRATGKPFMLVQLGDYPKPAGLKCSGWTMHGEDQGESWSASFDQPGILSRSDFRDEGYRWLVVRLTEGPEGGAKTILVNSKVVGEFVRTGPPVEKKKEWWVTRCYRIPEGLLKDGELEIRFEKPGIAVSAVALAVESVGETESRKQ